MGVPVSLRMDEAVRRPCWTKIISPVAPARTGRRCRRHLPSGSPRHPEVGRGQDFGCKQENQESPGKPREDAQHQYDNQTDASPVDEDIACTTERGQEAGESAEVELPRPLVSMELAVVDMQAWCKWRWVDRPTKARRDRTKPKAKHP